MPGQVYLIVCLASLASAAPDKRSPFDLTFNPSSLHQPDESPKPETGPEPADAHKKEVHENVKTIIVTKKIPVPYAVHVEKKVPYPVKVTVRRPFTVYVPKPYLVEIPKPVPYTLKVPVPQPYTIEKHVPVPYKVTVDKPVPVQVPKPYPVYVEKKVPFAIEKPVPYQVKVPVDQPIPIEVPVEKPVPYQVDKHVPVPVHSVERPVRINLIEKPHLGQENVDSKSHINQDHLSTHHSDQVLIYRTSDQSQQNHASHPEDGFSPSPQDPSTEYSYSHRNEKLISFLPAGNSGQAITSSGNLQGVATHHSTLGTIHVANYNPGHRPRMHSDPSVVHKIPSNHKYAPFAPNHGYAPSHSEILQPANSHVSESYFHQLIPSVQDSIKQLENRTNTPSIGNQDPQLRHFFIQHQKPTFQRTLSVPNVGMESEYAKYSAQMRKTENSKALPAGITRMNTSVPFEYHKVNLPQVFSYNVDTTQLQKFQESEANNKKYESSQPVQGIQGVNPPQKLIATRQEVQAGHGLPRNTSYINAPQSNTFLQYNQNPAYDLRNHKNIYFDPQTGSYFIGGIHYNQGQTPSNLEVAHHKIPQDSRTVNQEPSSKTSSTYQQQFQETTPHKLHSYSTINYSILPQSTNNYSPHENQPSFQLQQTNQYVPVSNQQKTHIYSSYPPTLQRSDRFDVPQPQPKLMHISLSDNWQEVSQGSRSDSSGYKSTQQRYAQAYHTREEGNILNSSPAHNTHRTFDEKEGQNPVHSVNREKQALFRSPSKDQQTDNVILHAAAQERSVNHNDGGDVIMGKSKSAEPPSNQYIRDEGIQFDPNTMVYVHSGYQFKSENDSQEQKEMKPTQISSSQKVFQYVETPSHVDVENNSEKDEQPVHLYIVTQDGKKFYPLQPDIVRGKIEAEQALVEEEQRSITNSLVQSAPPKDSSQNNPTQETHVSGGNQEQEHQIENVSSPVAETRRATGKRAKSRSKNRQRAKTQRPQHDEEEFLPFQPNYHQEKQTKVKSKARITEHAEEEEISKVIGREIPRSRVEVSLGKSGDVEVLETKAQVVHPTSSSREHKGPATSFTQVRRRFGQKTRRIISEES